ncbi:hypothetical protein HTIA_0054 [Halorhabdus tiamatea SARL4B]|uniref:Uncharacterized protein n=1 Tax=Halorhabdus tiamatea SARL4B TaxID=1033806 RepID=S6D170_9EURY|nr:hypothetical protein HTIA_0054 [Halorhabdus tiamatea SARL4B]
MNVTGLRTPDIVTIDEEKPVVFCEDVRSVLDFPGRDY